MKWAAQAGRRDRAAKSNELLWRLRCPWDLLVSSSSSSFGRRCKGHPHPHPFYTNIFILLLIISGYAFVLFWSMPIPPGSWKKWLKSKRINRSPSSTDQTSQRASLPVRWSHRQNAKPPTESAEPNGQIAGIVYLLWMRRWPDRRLAS